MLGVSGPTDEPHPEQSMTVRRGSLAPAGRGNVLEPDPGFDELAAPDGTPRRGWNALLEGFDHFVDADLGRAQREVARLLEDDNVTYTPSPTSSLSVVDEPVSPVMTADLTEPRPWRLDPVPLVLDDRDWAGLEAGVVQRAELLDAILADLYGPRRLLASGDIPPAAVLDHGEYLRPVVGTESLATQRLFLIAARPGPRGAGAGKGNTGPT